MGVMFVSIGAMMAIMMLPFILPACGLTLPLLCAGCTSLPLGIIGGSLPDLLDSCVMMLTLPCFMGQYIVGSLDSITQVIGVCMDSANELSKLPKAIEDLMKSFESEWSNVVYFCGPSMDYCSALGHSLFRLLPPVLIYDFFCG